MKLLDRAMRAFVQAGNLNIIDTSGETHRYGSGAPSVTIRLKDKRLYTALVFSPEMSTGEAYMNGTLEFEAGTLRDFLELYALNKGNLPKTPLRGPLKTISKKLKRLVRSNSPKKSRQNVAHHYDISNELYSLFLDRDMNYSCAYFRKPDDTLETAQRNKLRHIAAKLALKPGQRVLDIGCGWGAMSMYLAEAADVHVTGVTLSVEQHALACKRADERGLGDRVRFELKDYRHVTGPFDRIVSIGMFEHVGVAHYDEFFGQIARLLTDDGVALLHSIGRRSGPGSTAPWIQKYIFPGGYSPALSETLSAVEAAKLWVTDIEILRLHYAETLKEWDRRFQANRALVADMMDERFCRMWEYYLATSEFSFRHLKHMVFQIQLTKSIDAVPISRDYMAADEAGLPMRLAHEAGTAPGQP